jgi:hypothetical protein
VWKNAAKHGHNQALDPGEFRHMMVCVILIGLFTMASGLLIVLTGSTSADRKFDGDLCSGNGIQRVT